MPVVDHSVTKYVLFVYSGEELDASIVMDDEPKMNAVTGSTLIFLH